MNGGSWLPISSETGDFYRGVIPGNGRAEDELVTLRVGHCPLTAGQAQGSDAMRVIHFRDRGDCSACESAKDVNASTINAVTKSSRCGK